ncbi:MAG: TrmH family RNA methyltransferase [Bdellovibrionales bacterium]|nr:TrmH family RNA methyltransferase [Bdellovibrionales bacterium]
MTSDFSLTITSESNAKFLSWKKLDSSQAIKKQGEFLISGRKIVPEVLKTKPLKLIGMIKSTNHVDLSLPVAYPLAKFTLSPPLFRQLDILGTNFPILLAQTPTFPLFESDPPPQEVEILSSLSDPQNVGALARTALAFGIKKIILLKESAFPFHLKAIKASSGAVFHMEFYQGPSIHELPLETPNLVALDSEGTDINKFCWPQNPRILMGEEGQGLPVKLQQHLLAQRLIRIPIVPQVESLNAVVATSIALYAYRHQ